MFTLLNTVLLIIILFKLRALSKDVNMIDV